MTGDPGNDSAASFRDYDEAFAETDATGVQSLRWKAFDRMEVIDEREDFYAPVYYTNQGFLVRPSVRGWQENAIDIVDWRGIHLVP
jgi:ABC-type oligopeptide transport system substrate-binding subunit